MKYVNTKKVKTICDRSRLANRMVEMKEAYMGSNRCLVGGLDA